MVKIKPTMYKPGSEKAPRRPDVIEHYKGTAGVSAAEGEPADAPVKLLDALFAHMPQRKRTTVKDFLRLGQVKVNGTVVTRHDTPVTADTVIDVNTSRQWQTFSNPRIKIVYEDDDILVVNKGYGLLSVGTGKINDGTAYAILRDYLKRQDPRNKIFVVHRLDQHTSGLMMFAKSVEAKEAMQHNWNNMVLERNYAAVVEGRLEETEGTQRSFLAENVQHMVYSTTPETPGAKEAVTHWKKVRARGGYTLLDVSLDTGRKNQIRVHMHDLGHPIAGDRKYGAKTSPIHRLALHARTLRFIHPVTRRDMRFEIPLPASFSKLV